MYRDDVINRLKAAECALRGRGVLHAALFGSIARGDGGPESDVDILVDLDPDVVRTIYDYVGVKRVIADAVGGAVDVVDREALRSHVQPSATADAIYAF